jgi:hypothetical protein
VTTTAQPPASPGPAGPTGPSGPPPGRFTGPRAAITAKTLRKDRYWVEPAITVTVLLAFIVYSTIRAFQNAYYYAEPLISPFYSPCLAKGCGTREGSRGVEHLSVVGSWFHLGSYQISPALIILIFPLGFRLTCYYYRKAYYRSFWMSPPACAVAEPHKTYSGETKFPLLGQNLHRYFFYFGLIFNAILTYDAIDAFRNNEGDFGHVSLGTLVLLANAALLWAYSLSCHSCRHIMGGRMNHFSKHPVRYRMWTFISKLNGNHMKLAWVSLIGVALTDAYVLCVASATFSNPVFF